MRATRREFLGLATGAGALLLGHRGAAREPGAQTALGIHRATRNTRLGAIGTRLRATRAARRPFKPYPGRPREGLAMPAWEDGRALFDAVSHTAAAGFSGAPVSRALLARLLFLTNGVTGASGPRALRTAPSAGSLYAGEVYVVAARIDGLAPGVYSYAVHEHQLVHLRGGDLLDELAGALAGPDAARGAAAAVLVTNVFARYRVRYANRGYRYALIDTGHIGENLRLAAAESGLAHRTPLRWEDERLDAILGVDGREEAVCAVHLVGRTAGEGDARGKDTRRLVERQTLRSAPPRATSAPDAYHAATRLVAAGGDATGHAPSAAEAPAVVAPAERDEPAPDPGAPVMPVHAAIRVRRSTRRFEPRAMALPALLRILACARANPASWITDALDLYVVVHRVEDLAPGLYRYDPAARALRPRRQGRLAESLVEASLGQRKTGEAAAAAIAVARLAEASAGGGARAYRHLLLDAGATAQRLYLAAEAHGLTARNLSATYDDELDALLGLDGRTEVSLHLTALGAGD